MSRFGYGRTKTEAHEKSMGRYEMNASSDACSIAAFLIEYFESQGMPIEDVKKRFDAIDVKVLEDYEGKVSDLVATFLGKTVGQRPAFFKNITKELSVESKIPFLMLCVIGAERAKRILYLRDQYRMVLAPGSGYRATTAGIYSFSMAMLDLYDYSWPGEAFQALGHYLDDYVDDEEEEENE